MRYKESRQQSAEVLRSTLALMGAHGASLNPHTFAVWYEHVAAINSKLSAAIGEHLSKGTSIGDEAIERLYRDYVGDPDESALRRAGTEFERVMDDVSQGASNTDNQASRFATTLESMRQALEAPDEKPLSTILGDALGATSDMSSSVATLRRLAVASLAQIDQLRRDLNLARDESRIDGLTRLLNRAAFEQELAAMVSGASNSAGHHCLVMLDLDHFKAINDTYGHIMGDRVLQAVGLVLREVVSDPQHVVARYGGEEFAILLPDCFQDAAIQLAETCRQRVRGLRIRDRRTQNLMLTVTVSAGVAELQAPEGALSLVSRADAAMYDAKRAGRDQVASA